MPSLEARIIEPIWDRFSALLPDHDVDIPSAVTDRIASRENSPIGARSQQT